MTGAEHPARLAPPLSARIKGFLAGEHGGRTIITGELTPIQRERLEQTMKPEQIESLGLARNILSWGTTH
eukprot:COSAG05_NODE_553_length_8711_cov_165.199257_2_plen_70_part_00